MFSSNKSSYKKGIASFIINSLRIEHNEDDTTSMDHVQPDLAEKYAKVLQTRWRQRQAKRYVAQLRQENDCRRIREEMKLGVRLECSCCTLSDSDAELASLVNKQRFNEIQRLLFCNMPQLAVYDSGENWNQRFQQALELPEDAIADRLYKYKMLTAVNKDFVSTAVTYAKTIISEYFLHSKDRSILPKNLGGIAGGCKYVWRGILFKLADGSSGPWNGSDEAAMKAAGHDLKGAIHYFNTKVRELKYPLIALIDYKGFRMTAQALLPLSSTSLKYGSNNAGKVVHCEDSDLNNAMKTAATRLNLRNHIVGQLTPTSLDAAVDIEGHKGLDGRYYLLDMARSFPPEAPQVTGHLKSILADGSAVLVKQFDSTTGMIVHLKGYINRAFPQGTQYDVLFEDGSIGKRIPAELLQDINLSIFWRLLRPEFVKTRGMSLLRKYDPAGLTSLLFSSSKEEGGFDEEPSDEDGSVARQKSKTTIQGTVSDNHDYERFSLTTGDDGGLSVGDVNVSLSGYSNLDTSHLESTADKQYTYYEAFEEPSATTNRKLPTTQVRVEPQQVNDENECRSSEDFMINQAGCKFSNVVLLNETGKQEDSNKQFDYTFGTPLSPDALTGFSKLDPQAVTRNMEVVHATEFLINRVVPSMAKWLMEMDVPLMMKLDLSVEFHRKGINMRHIGLVRHHVIADEQFFALRQRLLLEIVSRALKNILRDFERRWMKAEQSTSEQGISLLIVQVLNMVTGAHENSSIFWRDRVVTGVIQRFGDCSLSVEEKCDLQAICSKPSFLKALLKSMIDMSGVVLTPISMAQFLSDQAPYKFQFLIADIHDVEARVKYMHIVDLGQGLLMAVEAEHATRDAGDPRVIDRLNVLAREHFLNAHRSVPSDSQSLTLFRSIDNCVNSSMIDFSSHNLISNLSQSTVKAKTVTIKKIEQRDDATNSNNEANKMPGLSRQKSEVVVKQSDGKEGSTSSIAQKEKVSTSSIVVPLLVKRWLNVAKKNSNKDNDSQNK